ENVDFSLSPLTIPARFRHIRYNGARYPGAEGVVGLDGGANCQQCAYELIRHFGFAPPVYRSSELWEDETHTRAVVGELEPCDLLLFNRTLAAWGAHVAVHLGSKLAIHLSRRAGVPVIWKIEDFGLRPESKRGGRGDWCGTGRLAFNEERSLAPARADASTG